MGKILNGILGGVSGKVSGVVGASWKGINYLRGYSIPSNPQTPAQTAQRAKMTFLVSIGRSVLSTVLNVFWSPIAVQMSGFNLFLQRNLLLITDDTDYDSILMSTGNLSPLAITTATYNPTTGMVLCQFVMPSPNPYVSLVDSIHAVFVHIPSGISYYATEIYTTGDDVIQSVTPASLVPTDFHCYLFASKGVGTEILTPQSVNEECVEG